MNKVQKATQVNCNNDTVNKSPITKPYRASLKKSEVDASYKTGPEVTVKTKPEKKGLLQRIDSFGMELSVISSLSPRPESWYGSGAAIRVGVLGIQLHIGGIFGVHPFADSPTLHRNQTTNKVTLGAAYNVLHRDIFDVSLGVLGMINLAARRYSPDIAVIGSGRGEVNLYNQDELSFKLFVEVGMGLDNTGPDNSKGFSTVGGVVTGQIGITTNVF